MKQAAVIACVLLSVVTALAAINNTDEFINHINSLKTTWKAGRNFHQDIPTNYSKRLLGTQRSDEVLPIHTVPPLNSEIESFDARQKWPDCPTISEIRDQGACHDWAFGAAGAMSDRICIHSKGKVKVRLSSQDLVACCNDCGFGCISGTPYSGWRYWVHNGIATGGAYGSNQGCIPESIPPCEHFGPGKRPSCTGKSQDTPQCVKTCQPGYKKKYQYDLYFGQTVYSVSRSVSAIQAEVAENGPVQATFMVHEDFLQYKSGVYQYVAGRSLVSQSGRLLGWGVENGTPYWLVANSWNTDWGDKGYFKILRGKDMCGIESTVVAGMPKL